MCPTAFAGSYAPIIGASRHHICCDRLWQAPSRRSATTALWLPPSARVSLLLAGPRPSTPTHACRLAGPVWSGVGEGAALRGPGALSYTTWACVQQPLVSTRPCQNKQVSTLQPGVVVTPILVKEQVDAAKGSPYVDHVSACPRAARVIVGRALAAIGGLYAMWRSKSK